MLKLLQRGLTNEERKILPSKKGGAGGVLARTIGRALPNLYPPLVAGRGLVRGQYGEVRTMRKILEEGSVLCLTCGEGLDGALINYEEERGQAQPACDRCGL